MISPKSYYKQKAGAGYSTQESLSYMASGVCRRVVDCAVRDRVDQTGPACGAWGEAGEINRGYRNGQMNFGNPGFIS